MIKIDGCNAVTAKPVEEIVGNIKENIYLKLPEIDSFNLWRETAKIAIVGGGPSLKYTLKNLHNYKHVMACGSAHDFLMVNNVCPDYCVLCDPDDIVTKYLTKKSHITEYLIASQCSPKTFEHLIDNKCYIWHAGSGNFDISNFGRDKIVIGGGCTVGTRAICLAMGMGFSEIHLYGFDTCLDDKFNHHAYSFIDGEKETIGNIHEIRIGGPEGKKFYVAGYMLGQLFDFQNLLKIYADRIKVKVYGDGLLKHLMDLAEKEHLK